MSLALIRNEAARRLFLDRHALIEPPTGPAKGADLLALIRRLGFVQVDSVNTVERAHHMILWSRRQSYRPESLKRLLERDRTVFEHWTHDASIIPFEFYPYWQYRFRAHAERIRAGYSGWQGTQFQDKIDDVIAHIRDGGPVVSGEVGTDEARGKGGWWDWHPSKTALEFLWRTGVLAVCERRGFAKVYDLAERILPVCDSAAPPDEEVIDWACRSAFDRLGFATSGEIAAFWALIRPEDAKDWCARALARSDIEEVMVEGADGRPRRCYGLPGLMDSATPEPGSRIRILSPFDPALRDRNRTERLFGFHYRIEIFVPEGQRRYGYYVFPVLEGDRLIGRVDLRCRRAEGRTVVAAFWPERGVRLAKGRIARLETEIRRLAAFAQSPEVVFEAGWLRAGSNP